MTKVNLIESPYPLQSIKGLGPKKNCFIARTEY